MAAFRYEAFDAGGRARRGVVEAVNVRAVRDQLRSDGLFPVAIDAADVSPSRAESTRLGAAVLALTTRQLATLTGSGMPLEQALAAVSEQSDDPRVGRVIDSVRSQVSAGESLPAALSRFPRTFSGLYRGLVAVGAETGQLGAVLSRLADYLDARQALRAKFTSALIYPALITIIAFAVIATLMLYVVPQIVAVYQQSRQTLPLLTRMLIASSAFLRETGFYWLLLACIALVAALLYWRRPEGRARTQAALLRLPVVGRVIAGLDSARFASTLAILTSSGAPLLRALETASAVIWAQPIRAAAQSAALRVREGVTLSRALAAERRFPPLLVHLVASGEQSGELPAMLARAASEQETDVERRLTWLAALLQPLLIVVMGAIVLVLVLAVMLPIVSMNQLIR